MTRPRRLSWLFALVCASSIAGCPSTHDIEPDGSAPSGDTDASTDAAPLDRIDGATLGDAGGIADGGSADTRPSWPDASIPSDEPDVAPDARPSDDPSASEWVDPPVIGPDEDSGTTGTRVDLATEDADLSDGGPPWLAWDGDEWILTWTSPSGTVMRHLDASAQPITPRTVLPTLVMPSAWGHHQIAGWTATGEQRFALSFFDRNGTAIGAGEATRSFLHPVEVTRHAAIHGWATLSFFRPEGSDMVRHSLVTRIDGAQDVELDLGRAEPYGGGALAGIVSVASRLVAYDNDASSTTVRVLANAGLVASAPIQLDVGGYASATRLRDTVFLAVTPDRGAGQGFVIDPFTGAVGAPTSVGGIAGSFRMAGDDVGGTVGVCYMDAGTIRFALFGPTGAPLGRSITLSPSYAGVPSCAIGSASQDTYVVAWYGASVAHGNLHATVVHVNR